MPSPLPPPPPPAPGTRVRTIMFGEPWTAPGGEDMIARADGILLELLDGDRPVAALAINAETGIALALAIQKAAVGAINQSVDDKGNPPSLTERFSRLSNAFQKGQP